MIKANPRNYLFETVKMTAPERNGFDLSHENKQTCKAGYLYPFELLETLPNDDFEIQTESFIRLMPMLSPTMHRLNAYWHWFFIPNRLCWNYWEEFISRGNGKKLPAGNEYTPPEPVTISLYDMIYSIISVYKSWTYTQWTLEVTKRSGLELEEIGRLSTDEALSLLSNIFPDLNFISCKDVDGGVNRIFEFVTATPRIATSMGIVDTCVYGGYIQESLTGYEFTSLYIKSYNPEEYEINKRLNNIRLSVMPFVAYLLTYNEYYRDENLIEELTEVLDFFREATGPIDMTVATNSLYVYKLMSLFYRAWEKDYFTTATTMPQKAPDVVIPGGGAAGGEIVSDGQFRFAIQPGNFSMAGNTVSLNSFGYAFSDDSPTSSSVRHRLQYQGGLKIEGSSESGSTTVADVRRSFALQRWFEKAVRTGTRYIESLKAFFNSDAGDARLQRPEYLGGTSTPIQISDVVQNSATADGSDTPQGNLAGYGIASDNAEVLRYHAPEHGFILGIFSILARTAYCQGIPRAFSRETWLDYAWPEFEHIGEQAVLNKEIAAAPLTKDVVKHILDENFNAYFTAMGWNPSSVNQNFGFQSRYSDYKQIQDRFGGAFARSLDFWTLGRMFGTQPTLSEDFVNAKISDRNFAVSNDEEEFELSEQVNQAQNVDTDQYQCDFWIDVKKVTSLTLFSEPI